MPFAKTTIAAVFAIVALPAFAHDGMAVRDAYVQVSAPTAQSAAAFMVIENHRAFDDRLVAVSTEAAERAELHTHTEDENGVMRMLEVEEGFLIPAGGEYALDRGGDHLMFLGLTGPLAQGEVVQIILSFEQSGDLEVEVPVSVGRQETGSSHQGHGHQGHDHQGHGDHGHDHSDEHSHEHSHDH